MEEGKSLHESRLLGIVWILSFVGASILISPRAGYLVISSGGIAMAIWGLCFGQGITIKYFGRSQRFTGRAYRLYCLGLLLVGLAFLWEYCSLPKVIESVLRLFFWSVLAVGCLYLLTEAFDKRLNPTRVGFGLLGRLVPAGASQTELAYRFLWKRQTFTISVDGYRSIRRAAYLDEKRFTERDRAFHHWSHVMGEYATFNLRVKGAEALESIDGIPVRNIWFIHMHGALAVYEIESRDERRYFMVEDTVWPESLFRRYSLDESIILRSWRTRWREVGELGRRIRERKG